MNKKSKIWLLVLLGAVLAKFALGKIFMYSCVSRYFSLAEIQAHSLVFKYYVVGHYGISVLMYIALYAFTIAIGIPGVAPLSLLGGYLFGILLGTTYGAIGATTGSLIAFIVVRYVLRDWVMRRYGHKFEKFNAQMNKYGANYLLMVHYASVIPFFFINTLAAMSDIGWWTFIWTTVVGFIPLAMIYSFAGRELATIKSLHDILSPQLIAVFILLIFLAFLPIVIKHYRDNGQTKTE